jgi:uncharacterized membrane protein
MKFGSAFKDTKQISEGIFGMGTQVLKKASFLGREIDAYQQVTAFVPNQLIVFESLSGPVATKETCFFEAQEDGSTRVVIISEVEPKGMLKLAGTAIRNKVESQMVKDLGNLKAILEEGIGL